MDDALHNWNQWRSISSVTVLTLVLAWESLAPFLTYFAGSTGERVRHGLKNLALGVMNSLLIGFGFAALWWTAAQWAQAHEFGLLNWLTLPAWARLAGAFLLFDAWMYWWHRLNHRVPFLWRFHRMHHSDPKMDVTTANRFHLGEIALSSVLRVIIVTPYMHKVHHSRWQPETDSNYSSLFSFWDRLFRSFRLRDDPRTLRFGLDEFNRPEDHTLRGLLATPLKQVQRATGEPPAKATSHL